MEKNTGLLKWNRTNTINRTENTLCWLVPSTIRTGSPFGPIAQIWATKNIFVVCFFDINLRMCEYHLCFVSIFFPNIISNIKKIIIYFKKTMMICASHKFYSLSKIKVGWIIKEYVPYASLIWNCSCFGGTGWQVR
jgi:hypothetical protein